MDETQMFLGEPIHLSTLHLKPLYNPSPHQTRESQQKPDL